MRRGVLWDSSAILALIDADDADHHKAVEVAHEIAAERRPCFITNYIEVEAHALLLRKLGRALARDWLLRATLPVVRPTSDDEDRAKEIIATHTDKDWSLCDTMSFAVMDARRVRTAFSFDHHFQQYGRFELLGLENLQ